MLAEVLRKAQLPESFQMLVVIALVLSMSITNCRDAGCISALNLVLKIAHKYVSRDRSAHKSDRRSQDHRWRPEECPGGDILRL